MRRYRGGVRRGGCRGGGRGILGSSYVLCCESASGGLLLSSSAHRTLLEIRAILLSRTSATLPSPFLPYLRQVFLFSQACARLRTSPLATIFLPAPSVLLDHYRFLRSLVSSSTHLFYFLYVNLAITWPQRYDSQSQLRRAFPVTILLTGQSLSLTHFAPFR